MTDEAAEIFRALEGKASVNVYTGTFVSMSAAAAKVDLAGGRVTVQLMTSYLPEVGEPVRVVAVDGIFFLLGPTQAKPTEGTVLASPSGGLVNLQTLSGVVRAPYSSTVTPAAGQVMQIVWGGGPFAIAVKSTSPPASVAPPAPGGGATTHVDPFTAIDAGSFQGARWWTAQPWASDNNLGAWFYGSKVADTIPAGASMQKVEIYISPEYLRGSAPNFALHPHQTKPAGAPTLSSVTAVAVSAGWVTLPNNLWNALRAGGGAAGIGLSHGGDNKFRSLAQDGQSGALRITSIY